MIFYSPINGDVQTTKVVYRPRTCFLMTQLGGDIPDEVEEIRDLLLQVLKVHRLELINAASEVTGKDFLHKIWQMIVSVPLGVAVLHEGYARKDTMQYLLRNWYGASTGQRDHDSQNQGCTNTL